MQFLNVTDNVTLVENYAFHCLPPEVPILAQYHYAGGTVYTYCECHHTQGMVMFDVTLF